MWKHIQNHPKQHRLKTSFRAVFVVAKECQFVNPSCSGLPCHKQTHLQKPLQKEKSNLYWRSVFWLSPYGIRCGELSLNNYVAYMAYTVADIFHILAAQYQQYKVFMSWLLRLTVHSPLPCHLFHQQFHLAFLAETNLLLFTNQGSTRSGQGGRNGEKGPRASLQASTAICCASHKVQLSQPPCSPWPTLGPKLSWAGPEWMRWMDAVLASQFFQHCYMMLNVLKCMNEPKYGAKSCLIEITDDNLASCYLTGRWCGLDWSRL